MKVLNYESANGAQDERGDAKSVDANLGFHLVWSFGVKSLEAKSAELSGLAAASSWRLAGANLNLVAELVALEFARVNSSGVVATGSNSSPRSNALRRSNDGQGIANIDVDHLVPANGNRGEWVGDNHAFVEKLNLRSNENQVSRDHAGRSPQAAGDGGQGIFGQPQGCGEHGAKDQNNAGQYVATTRSKNLSITHVSIIAGDKKCLNRF